MRLAQKAELAKLREGKTDDDETNIDELSAAIRDAQLTGLPVELVGKLLSALREIIPAAGDKFVTSAWLEVVHSCIFTLSASDKPKNSLSHLPNIIKRF